MLDQASVPYMIAGSFASTYHGPPRATRELGVADLWRKAAGSASPPSD